jgi:hypothetical protein
MPSLVREKANRSALSEPTGDKNLALPKGQSHRYPFTKLGVQVIRRSYRVDPGASECLPRSPKELEQIRVFLVQAVMCD